MRLRTSVRTSRVDAPADLVWQRLTAGLLDDAPGRHWHRDALPFRFRVALDRLVGGPSGSGLWEVEQADGRILLMRARVRAPGVVRVQTELEPAGAGTRITQSVRFDPDGLLGVGYLLADLPAREVVIELVHRAAAREVLGDSQDAAEPEV